MSVVRGQLGAHDRYQADRQRARRHADSMWSDTAARGFFDVLDELEVEDRAYRNALADLDAEFDRADKLLGPI